MPTTQLDYPTAERIDFRGKTFLFEILKQRKRGCFRSVPVPNALIVLLRHMLTDLETTARVWNFSRASGYRLVKEQFARAGVGGGMATPKDLRHGFAVACLA